MDSKLQVFSGSANRPLAMEIADHLGIPLGHAYVGAFRDGETRIRIEDNVRGADVFVVQPTCKPTNQHIMELLLMLEALRRASARRITAVVPYYGYARQEKKSTGREPIAAKLVANMVTVAGAKRVLAMDLHTPAIEGFFDIPVDHLRAVNVLTNRCRQMELDNLVIVSPDAGGVLRANDFRARMRASLAIIAKHRPQPDVTEMLEMVGEVRGKNAVIVDDIIGTGGTLIEAAEMLMERGARAVYAFAVHAPMADGAAESIGNSHIRRVVVTNTIPLTEEQKGDKIEVLTVAPLIAEAIKRIHEDVSVSALFT
jgi:ribose-phosphate pyrophosphokinase